jgi:hypothetical protein
MSTDIVSSPLSIKPEQYGVHPSAVGPESNLQNDQNNSDETNQDQQANQTPPDSDYPEQRHAGK